MAYSNGVVSVGTAATLICTPGRDGAMVQNLGAAVVYLGGPGVTAMLSIAQYRELRRVAALLNGPLASS